MVKHGVQALPRTASFFIVAYATACAVATSTSCARKPAPVVAATLPPSHTLQTHLVKPKAPPARVTKRKGDLYGGVMVLMYHKFEKKETRYDRSLVGFREDLEDLDAAGFRPVTVDEYVNNKMNLPPGASPVVVTMDDAAPSQFQLDPDGAVDPDCAAGIWINFAKQHPEFPFKATFFVLPKTMWDQPQFIPAKLAILYKFGCQIGDHTWTHPDLAKLTDTQVEKEFGRSAAYLKNLGYSTPAFAYPYGIRPRDMKLLSAFTYNGETSGFDSAFTCDTDLAPSPISKRFNRYRIPRIEATETPHAVRSWIATIVKGDRKVYVQP